MEHSRSSDDWSSRDSAELDAAAGGNGSELNGDDEAGRGGSNGGGSRGARYKLMSPAKLPISRSPCLTIPPGLSPSSFLESPVLLSNVKVSGRIKLKLTLLGLKAPADSSNQQSGQSMQVQPQSFPGSFASSAGVRSEVAASSNELSLSAHMQEVAPIDTLPAQTDSDESNKISLEIVQRTDQSGLAASMNERTSDDGYNWRKYGQKLVKGSEYPRSYYKCTHPNCEVKKLFERAPDGKITEIIYKGTHDHPKPQPNRRLSAGSIISIQEDRSDKFSTFTGQEDKPSTIAGQIIQNKDPAVAAETSAPKSNENVEVGLSPLNRIPDDADEDDDPFVKRRKMEIGSMDINSVIKPIREPRVVVQTLSEVDILDDGYRWRKYGQKVVRGNPNPRSYYKCTSAGCPVRKHVERASHDPKAVITTYEGKHNHDVPTARNNNNNNNNNNNHDTSPSLPSRARQQDGETVSLDLVVGTSSAADNSHGQHQAMETERALGQAQINRSNLLLLHASPVTAYPSYKNMHPIWVSWKMNVNCGDKLTDTIQPQNKAASPEKKLARNSSRKQVCRNRYHELKEGDPSRCVIEKIFSSACSSSTTMDPTQQSIKIKKVLRVKNPQETVDRFEKYREKVKKKASVDELKRHPRNVVDGNEILCFYPTTMNCCTTRRPSKSASSDLCEDYKCRACRIVETRLIAGRVMNLVEGEGCGEDEGSYDSIRGEGFSPYSEYLMVRNPDAMTKHGQQNRKSDVKMIINMKSMLENASYLVVVGEESHQSAG
ncbi:hypothetical protein V2J09_015223 [Rumex salicifolius]